MSSSPSDALPVRLGMQSGRLYDLLPAIYRIRDAERGAESGWALEALLSVIDREVAGLRDDFAGLYDDLFVETCREWVLPYIGDLLEAAPLASTAEGGPGRAVVANTIAYRRRKGTAAVLEQLARDITGWPARVVEYFQRLDWTQYVNHVRLEAVRTHDLRAADRLELVGSPFEAAARTPDVRSIARNRGRNNIPNIGLFLWRLQPYHVREADARGVNSTRPWRLTFNPFGHAAPLFNRPQTERDITGLAREENVPGVLRRRVLYRELEEWRQAFVDGETPEPMYFGADAVLSVRLDGEEVPAEEVLICHLEKWRRPARTRVYRRSSDGHIRRRRIRVAVDPVLGRLALARNEDPERIQVSYRYGFSGDLGGGPYNREPFLTEAPGPDDTTWQIGVSRELSPVPGSIVPSMGEAVEAWNAQPPGSRGVIAVMDSATYAEPLTGAGQVIIVPAGSTLLVVAAAWPRSDPDAPPGEDREPGRFAPDGLCPHLLGDVTVRGRPGAEGQALGRLIIDGLWIEGRLRVAPGMLGSLTLSNCTLSPGHGGLVAATSGDPARGNDGLEVRVVRSITGRIRLPGSVPELEVRDSIVDATGTPGRGAIVAPGADAEVEASTIFGTTTVRTLSASNAIFRQRVTVTHRQTGCVRFSYLPLPSRVPRRYRCQPVDKAGAPRVSPLFTSEDHGGPGYGQLAPSCPAEIARGADDEGEMGAFHFLRQHVRMGNLEAHLDRYLRFGLEAGVFFET